MPLAPQEIRTFFVTTVCANRRRLFQVGSNAELLLNILQESRMKGRLQLHAFVVMPDHIHLLVTPAENISIEQVMQFIKGGFSFRLKSKLNVWQPGFTVRRIEDPHDYRAHHRYIHENPVRAGLCISIGDFLYSSAHEASKVDPAPYHLGHQSPLPLSFRNDAW